jgi:hypothetical protein
MTLLGSGEAGVGYGFYGGLGRFGNAVVKIAGVV